MAAAQAWSQSEKETLNGLRIIKLLMTVATGALQDEFLGIITSSNNSLQNFFIPHQSSLKQSRYLNKSQLTTLFPASGNQPDIKAFDISLLYALFRNLHASLFPPNGLNLPHNDWETYVLHNEPPSHRVTRGLSVNALQAPPVIQSLIVTKKFRNKFSHLSKLAISDQDFQQYWTDLEQYMKLLGVHQTTLDECRDSVILTEDIMVCLTDLLSKFEILKEGHENNEEVLKEVQKDIQLGFTQLLAKIETNDNDGKYREEVQKEWLRKYIDDHNHNLETILREGIKYNEEGLNNVQQEIRLSGQNFAEQVKISEKHNEAGISRIERKVEELEEAITKCNTIQGKKGDTLTKKQMVQAVTVSWKQESFLGFGGDRSQVYNIYHYAGPSGEMIPVYVQGSYQASDSLVVDEKLQFGMNDGQFFLVYHDKSQKPYQHRFLKNDMQKQLMVAHDLMKEKTGLDMTWIIGDLLRDF